MKAYIFSGNLEVAICCDALEKELKEDYMISAYNNRKEGEGYGVYFESDGGHGGELKINYCPFCGEKINYKIL